VRLLKWCSEIGLTSEWNLLCGFPGEDPAEYERMADLVPALTHLPPPNGSGQIRLDRFSPYFAAPEANGMTNVRASIAYSYVYPFSPADLDRLAYYFDYDYADGRDPARYTAPLQEAIAAWRASTGTARLELRLGDDRLELQDTRPVAARELTVLEGPARLAYLALDSGTTVGAVEAELGRALGDDAPGQQQIGRWLDGWLADRLVMREGPRYLSLATNPSERIQMPVERFLEQLAAQPRNRAF
jgi:hypothetical protein